MARVTPETDHPDAGPPEARPPEDGPPLDPDDRAAVRERADQLLRALAGPTAHLRPDQWSAIEALVVDRRRALVVQRTGWGKSAVYFLAARLLRLAGNGPAVIVSPLLALMRNQVAAAGRAGVRAATLNSANMTEWDEVRQDVRAGRVDVLLISPERLNNPDFRDTVLPALSRDSGLVVVDEAHCVSDWGHDFRPDYRRIRSLLGSLPAGVPVLATTATANDRVVRDVAQQLGVGAADTDTLVLRGGLDRESLRLSVVRIAESEKRAAWLLQHLDELPGSGIVYCLTVAAADDLAQLLSSSGHRVRAYTGRTDATEREALERALLGNEVKALVATSALGMGFDKPDLGFVVHVGAPPSPVAYYQQIGRAGRAAESAEVVLLPGAEDQAIWNHFAGLAFPAEEVVHRVLAALDPVEPRSTAALEPAVDLGRTRLEMVLKVLDVDGAVRRVRGGWLGTGRPWTYDAERYRGLAEARRDEQHQMIAYQRTAGCRMEFLRARLDDPTLAPDSPGCGRCDNCTGVHRDTSVDQEALRVAGEQLDKPGVVVEPRKQWPSGLAALDVPVRGRIRGGPAAGRALARLTDLGLGQRIRALLAEPDGPAPGWVSAACVPVLREWDWERRPGRVVALPDGDHPQLVVTLARGLAEVGRMRYLGEVTRDADLPPVTAQNSAYRVAALWGTFRPPPGLEGAGGNGNGNGNGNHDGDGDSGSPILLVGGLSDTGWTATVAATALREASGAEVLPLFVATAG